MAHVVTGIDLGASAVKFVLIEVGFRVQRLLQTFEEPVAPGEAPLFERQGDALQAGLARLPSESTVYMALPGETLAVRVLDLPFADPRKIDQVVGYELEGQIVHALQDVVYDHALLKPRGEGSSVMAVAARTDEVADFVAALNVRGVEPRSLFVAPVIYQALFGSGRGPAPVVDAGCRVLCDLGQRRTNVCFVSRGEAVYARTVTRGGDALTAAIAQAFRCDEAQAEQAKRSHGAIATPERPAVTPAAQRMDAVLREALQPLLRDLRQTLASFRARDKTPVDGLVLTGGAAGLVGLTQFLEEELGVPVSLYAPETGAGPDALADEAEQGRFTLAAAIAWAGARGSKEIDLRRGPFQYRASFSVIRQKAAHLGALAAALVVCATVDGTMALARLSKQKDQLQAQLKLATTELFGQPNMDAKAVTTLLKKGFREDMVQLPKATAFDLLDQISRKMPSAERIKVDITDLDIRPKKTAIKGTVDSAAAVDEMQTALKEIDCFEEITKGPVTEVSGGAKQFTLNIAGKCP